MATNFNSTTPAAPGGNTNVTWQTDGSGNLSGYAPTGLSNPMTTLGDIITGGSSGTPGRLAIGSTGQVLTVTAGAPAWAPASGGGVTLTAPVQVNWTAFNTSGMLQAPTYATSRFEFATNTSAGFNIQGVAGALPSAPYAKIFRIWPMLASVPYCAAGIGWADGSVGTPGKIVACNFYTNDPSGGGGGSNSGFPASVSVDNMTNVTTRSSTGTLPTGITSTMTVGAAQPVWMRLTDDNTNWIWDVSWDGSNWLTLFTVARNTFLTATQLVIFGNSGFSSKNVKVIFDSYA